VLLRFCVADEPGLVRVFTDWCFVGTESVCPRDLFRLARYLMRTRQAESTEHSVRQG
jgi:hypothetical protein